jgi:hypothetical protein
MSLDQFEESLRCYTGDTREANFVRARVFAGMGNEYYWQGDLGSAERFYEAALRTDPLKVTVAAKRALLSLGRMGNLVRTVTRGVKSTAREYL